MRHPLYPDGGSRPTVPSTLPKTIPGLPHRGPYDPYRLRVFNVMTSRELAPSRGC
jgi:hypothetical protein